MIVLQTRNMPSAVARPCAAFASIAALPTILPAFPSAKYALAEPKVNS